MVIIRVLFGLVAVAALSLLFSSPPSEFDEPERLERSLLLVGLTATGLGMAIPWSRWIRLTSPGRNLGFMAKVLGWVGASGVPLAVVSGYWLAALALIILPVSAVALWKGSAWAAWPWYAVAVGCLGASIAEVVVVLSGSRSGAESAYKFGQGVGALGGVVLWGGVSVALFREITAWRRNLNSSPPDSPPAP